MHLKQKRRHKNGRKSCKIPVKTNEGGSCGGTTMHKYIYIYTCTRMFFVLLACLAPHLSLFLSVSISVSIPLHLYASLSFSPSLSLSVYLFVFLFTAILSTAIARVLGSEETGHCCLCRSRTQFRWHRRGPVELAQSDPKVPAIASGQVLLLQSNCGQIRFQPGDKVTFCLPKARIA